MGVILPLWNGMKEEQIMYHSTLPPELEKHYIYTPDGGHSINCLLVEHASEAFATHSVREHLVPCPVRAVLRAGYSVQRGYVVVDLLYDTDLGLMTESEDDEY
jgi:hypothetical protein